MARIAGVDLPPDKRIVISLQYIYGIGKTTAKTLCEQRGHRRRPRAPRTSPTTRSGASARSSRRTYKVEGDLRREVTMNIKRLMDLGCYRGLRHRKGLPGPRPAHAHQRAHPQGSEARHRRASRPPPAPKA